jgi:hypothetical protein
MLYFREHQWLVVQGASIFRATIEPEMRQRQEVHWSLDMHFRACGPVWRRVRHWERPELHLMVGHFKWPMKSWTDLEHLNFWDPMAEDMPDASHRSGMLDIFYYPRCGDNGQQNPGVGHFGWRVATRERGWFTVELAGMTDSRSALELLEGRKIPVLPDGREERRDPDLAFWKKHAQVYLIENIPFGQVTVKVPHNVRDPEAYAVGRARQLIGVNEPEHIEVTDFNQWEKCTPYLRNQVYVELHFNGFYET